MLFDDCIVYRRIADTPSELADKVQDVINHFRYRKDIVKIDIQYVYGGFQYVAFITVFFLLKKEKK